MTEHHIPILAYHSFSPNAAKPWQYALEPSLLDEHFAYLREKNFFSLTLAECFQSRELALSAKPIVLTFNGAFEDFERVLPLLNKYDFNATLFVPTAFVGGQSDWLEAGQHRPLLSWEALRGLTNVEIGSLGHGHLNLAEVSEAAAKEDILKSKELLEDKLGLSCQTFAYPEGHHTPTTSEFVKEAGFIAACTLQARVSTLNNAYALPRFAITTRTSLPEITGTNSKSRFSFLDIFRPQRQRRLTAPTSRYISPPLPTKVTTEQVRQERNQQVTLLKSGLFNTELEPEKTETPNPSDTEVRTRPLQRESHPDTPVVGRHPTSTPLLPRSLQEEEQEKDIRRVTDLGQQGDFLADLKTLIAQQQGKHLIEYNMLLAATERLQASHEAEVFAPERVRAVYQTRAQLETALANERNKSTEQQRVQLQGYLDKLATLPTPDSLQGSTSNVKQILEEYLEHLNVEALSSDVLGSAESMVSNLEQRLNASYRAGLQQLVQEATPIKAMDFLIILQRASNALEQGHYPDLKTLRQSLDTLLEAEGSQHLTQKRSQQFAKELADAARVFETVSALNNEDVTTVRQILYYLLSQRELFPKVSATMQLELEASLKEAKTLLEGLEKDHQATQAVASQLVTGSVFDSIFGDSDTDSPKNS
jgi:peptidoglycan/xylan/chitin deacetylase (PgdA/CDA1 family)